MSLFACTACYDSRQVYERNPRTGLMVARTCPECFDGARAKFLALCEAFEQREREAQDYAAANVAPPEWLKETA
jgi:hypothetical protein